MKISKELAIIFLIQITEVLGFSLILPLLPFYAKSFGASPFIISTIPSLFSFFQFFSSPILGRLSDYYGRRPLLIISQSSTFISFLILAFSNSLFLIFLSRAVDGIFGSNFSIAQAYIADVTSKKDRSKAYGLSGVAFGIGFLIGPAIGGYLSRYGISIPAYIASLISLISVILTVFLLPETVKKDIKVKNNFKIIDIESITKYLKNKKTSFPIFELFTFNSTHVIWTTNFAIFSGIKYGFTAENVGYVLAYVGIINILIRGGVLPKLIDNFKEYKLKIFGTLSIIASLLILTLTKSPYLLFVSFTFFALGGGLVRPLMTAAISKSVNKNRQGSILGVSNSLNSFSQIIGPLIGGFVLTKFIPESLMIVSMFIMVLGLVLIKFNEKKGL